MATYYIDSLSGDNLSDGKSAFTPKENINGINISPGDTVLFRRGSEYRDVCLFFSGTPEAPLTFSTYGEGAAPKFYGSKNAG